MKWQRLGGVLVVMGVACSAQAAKPTRKAKPGATIDPVLVLRYPEEKKKREKGDPYPRVTQEKDAWIVESERSRLVFSPKTASITSVTVLGRNIPVRSVPDAMIIDAAGKVYHQAEAVDGIMRMQTTPEDKYLHVEANCTPRGPSGVSPVRLHLSYDIHKATGFTQVRVALDPGLGAKIREFSMEHGMGPDTQSMFPLLQVATPQGGARTLTDVPGTSSVVLADSLPFALWTDGVIGFELNGLDYKNAVIDPSIRARDTRHFLTAANHRENNRALDMVFVRTVPGKELELTSRLGFEYAFSFLPWRRFKPLYTLPAPTFESGGTAGNPPDPRLPAQKGITAAIGWESPQSTGSYEAAAHWAAIANRYGMQTIHAVGPRSFRPVFTRPTEPMWDRLNAHSLWLTPEQVREDLQRDPWRARDNAGYAPDGIAKADWPHNPEGTVGLDLGSQRARDFLFDNIRGWTGLIPTGMVHLDDFAPGVCTNTAHHCSAHGTMSTLGQHLFVERVKEMLHEHSPYARLSVGAQRGFNNSMALADFSSPGLVGTPDPAELQTVYNPFLRGTPVIWNYAGANTAPVDDLRTVEQALARCGMIAFGKGATPRQQKLIQDYFTPLSIYGIEQATLLHPSDPDWKVRYSANLDLVTPIFYERENDLLLVAVKNQAYTEPQPVTIKAEFYNWMEDKVILFDTVTRTVRRVEEKDGNLVVPRIRIDQGPQIIRVMKEPSDTEVVWHDPVAWRILSAKMEGGLHCKMAGVPDSRAMVYVYMASGNKPGKVSGAEVAAYDKQSRLLTLAVPFDSQGKAEFRVR